MRTTLLAHTAEDTDRVAALVGEWATPVPFHQLAVDRDAAHSPLVRALEAHTGPVAILISDAFLRNPNCLVEATDWLDHTPERSLLALDAELLDKLRSPTGRMEYVHYWQERYIDLRRDASAYRGEDKEAFERYSAKIRGVSVAVEDTLTRILQHQPVPAHQYQPPHQDRAEKVIARAWELAEAGDRGGARVQWKTAIESFPEEPDVRYEHALYLVLEERDLSTAREELDQVLEDQQLHPDALYLSGEVSRSLGRYAEAQEDWERLYDHEPNYPDLDLQLGILLSEHIPGAESMALNLLRRACKRKDAAPDTLYRYGTLLDSGFGKRGKAIKQLLRAVASDPEFAAAHYRLAVWYHEAGNREEARNHYILATARDGRYATPDNQLAFLQTTEVHPPSTPVPAASTESTSSPPPSMEDPLSSLKENIARLEELMSRQNQPAPASPPPRPGSGLTALISGATSGIGLATARRLSRSGYRLILLGRREERLNEVRRELTEGGTEVHTLQLDVRDREKVATTLSELPEVWRTVDILINNAGKAKGFDPIHRGRVDHWEEMIDVNLKGLLYLTRAVSPGMVERRSGLIINVASTAGKEVYPNGNVYCATKHGVDALTYSMRLDLVHHGIRVGQICPAHVEETEFALVRFDGDADRARIYEDFQPLRSEDVAEAIHFMVTQPPHVNVMDLVLQGTQQASSTVIDRSGRPDSQAEA
jgi:NADP-dependent 3-hydroxy acid dehydrogenase YdfG/Flp pilus assembly protein TadD